MDAVLFLAIGISAFWGPLWGLLFALSYVFGGLPALIFALSVRFLSSVRRL
jgi:hypothetical protein